MTLICPNCHHKEVLGAIFCSECGTQLIGEIAEATQMLSENLPIQSNDPAKKTTSTSPPPLFLKTAVSLYIMDSGQMIPLEGQSEYTLGRNAEGQSVISDIDLTPYHGYEQGVSRLHTSINIEENHVSATDLGSANGTRINGQKIPSYRPYSLKHGDIITLKLKDQILITDKFQSAHAPNCRITLTRRRTCGWEIDELPQPTDRIIVVYNHSRVRWKDLHYLAENVTTVIWPMSRMNFIEILPTKEQEEIIGFVRE
jgi:hypothetical protein